MKKIEEVAVLLVDEIESFQKTISVLQKETRKIENTNITIDTSKTESILNVFFKNVKNELKEHRNKVAILHEQFNNTTKISKWTTLILIALLSILTIEIYIQLNQSDKKEEIEKQAYQNGVNDFKNHLGAFFNEHPKASESYQIWNNKK